MILCQHSDPGIDISDIPVQCFQFFTHLDIGGDVGKIFYGCHSKILSHRIVVRQTPLPAPDNVDGSQIADLGSVLYEQHITHIIDHFTVKSLLDGGSQAQEIGLDTTHFHDPVGVEEG